MKFTVVFLPATYGDSLWIEYGEENELKRILIDGGTGGTKAYILEMLEQIPEDKRVFELMVVTHIDKDHIQGIEKLLEDKKLKFKVKDFWFNGWKHMADESELESFGSKQAENMTRNLLRHKLPWNDAFGGKAVVIPADGALPVIILGGGMKLTLLSPGVQQLRELKPVWVAELIKAGLIPSYGDKEPKLESASAEEFGDDMPNVDALNNMPFVEDKGEANASSIAFIAEYANKKILCLGDAVPSLIQQSLRRIQQVGQFKVDLLKVSHHASAGNTSPELIELLDCKDFAISTSGSIYGHPAQVTIARIIKRGGNQAKLFFNYRSDHNKIWDAQGLKTLYGYSTEYAEESGMKIELI